MFDSGVVIVRMTMSKYREVRIIVEQSSKGLDILVLCHCSGIERCSQGQGSATVQTP
jgi:hypothetical protein